LQNGAITQDGINVVYHAIDKLVFSEYNPRELTEHQHDTLVDSLKGFNWVVPIVVNTNQDRKNVVVGGHQRLKVARELGHSKVPCIEVDLPLEKEKELNIRLNQNTGQWDWDALANNFDEIELRSWGFEDKAFTGFTDVDYSVLEDEDLEAEMAMLSDGTRKAIQIEFTTEDYDEAYNLINEKRKAGVYVGGLLLTVLKTNLKG